METASRQDIQCRYFSRGCCLLGDRCPYSHGSSTSKAPRPATTCRFYQSGKCAFGAGCDHSSETAYLQKRSVGKQCGLCFEMIWEKELRFGILSKCKHSFCLDCIRNWKSQQETKKLSRSCPECRARSGLVVPSVFWIEDQNEKKLLIEMFKKNTKQTLCIYFKNNQKCPYGKRCYYMHQAPPFRSGNGGPVHVPPMFPPRHPMLYPMSMPPPPLPPPMVNCAPGWGPYSMNTNGGAYSTAYKSGANTHTPSHTQRDPCGNGRDCDESALQEPRQRVSHPTPTPRNSVFHGDSNAGNMSGSAYSTTSESYSNARSHSGPGQGMPVDETPLLEMWLWEFVTFRWLVSMLCKLSDAIVWSVQLVGDVAAYRAYKHSDRSGPPPNLVILDYSAAAILNDIFIPFSLFAFFLLSCRIVFVSLFSST